MPSEATTVFLLFAMPKWRALTAKTFLVAPESFNRPFHGYRSVWTVTQPFTNMP